MVFEEENGRRYVNENESVCFCREYRWSEGYVGPVGTTTDNDLEYCNKLIGHPPDNYKNVTEFYEKVRLWLESNRTKKSKRRQ